MKSGQLTTKALNKCVYIYWQHKTRMTAV